MYMVTDGIETFEITQLISTWLRGGKLVSVVLVGVQP
jgi:hypothetical protein